LHLECVSHWERIASRRQGPEGKGGVNARLVGGDPIKNMESDKTIAKFRPPEKFSAVKALDYPLRSAPTSGCGSIRTFLTKSHPKDLSEQARAARNSAGFPILPRRWKSRWVR
jgi:hypothetical protein